MKVVTESGSVYTLSLNDKGTLMAEKKGMQACPCVAVYPDRVPFVEDTVRVVRQPDGKHAGYNEKGVRTILVVPTQVRVGMVLINRRGFRSTAIREIIGRL
jgi:hypothetical protein